MKTNEEYTDEFGCELLLEKVGLVGINDSGNTIYKMKVVQFTRHFKPEKYKNTCDEKPGDYMELDETWLECQSITSDYMSKA